jgi:hypothetical protein
MPVLRQYHVFKPRRYPENHIDHCISIGNRQRAPGAKIVLHINHNQNVMRIRLHRVSRA